MPCVAASIMIMLAPSSALADSIYLKCEWAGKVEIDLSSKAVNGLPATITDTLIRWDEEVPMMGHPSWKSIIHYVIDRTSGSLDVSSSKITDDQRFDYSEHHVYPCEKTDKPATQF